jgi:hypothetical protein
MMLRQLTILRLARSEMPRAFRFMWGQPPPAVRPGKGRHDLRLPVPALSSFARPDSREPALSLLKGRLSPHESCFHGTGVAG